MSASVTLSGKLPGHEDVNGLDAIVEDLVDDPTTIRVALLWIDVPKITDNTETGARVPTVRVRRVEPLGTLDDIPDVVRDLAIKAHEARTGRTPLPFDDVTSADEDDPVVEEA